MFKSVVTPQHRSHPPPAALEQARESLFLGLQEEVPGVLWQVAAVREPLAVLPPPALVGAAD